MSKFQTSIHEYLETLPLQTFNRLYQKPATCLAIFRLLPPLGKQIIMSSLYVDTPIPVDDMKLWFKGKTGLAKHKEAMKRLQALHIFSEERGNYTMNTIFVEQFRNALTGGGNSQSFGLATSTPDKHHVDVAFLDDYATKQWEAILHFMVGTTEGRPPCKGVLNLLGRSGLMTGGPDTIPQSDNMDARDYASQMARHDFGVPKITRKGFQFLLQDINTQVWAFLLQYLNMAESLNMDLVEVLTFFFQLGSLELGNDYSSETLTPTQTHLLEDLKAYGIVYQRKRGSRRFYPTRLATTLTSGTPVMLGSHTNAAKHSAAASRKTEEEEEDDHGFIIMETNYRMYAYTVVDQIRLWEIEKNRLRPTATWLYSQFNRQQDFDGTLEYASELGVVLWSNPKKRQMCIKTEGHQAVGNYIRKMILRNKEQAQQHRQQHVASVGT
ncbi:RNA polymerase II transcription factor B 52 kDa subunit [Modicella reniformis]|uniref:RNA polymerase II transcription factor B subunit 2 n=1 Tax=Modicella reniformis TaxID=1440133 RepID=A0A9P6M8A9_9FUNG|nr:RNA polymerase II transcription factor B 52 kDa subunit [Modicella reniformis]